MSLAKQVFALSLSLAALGYTVIPAVQAAVKPDQALSIPRA